MHSSTINTYSVYAGREYEKLTGNSNTGNEPPEHPRSMSAYPSNKLHPDDIEDRIAQGLSPLQTDQEEVDRISCQEESQYMRVQFPIVIEEIL